MNLVAEGEVVGTAVGRNLVSGGDEGLMNCVWKVDDLKNRRVHIEIIDERRGGWGHINVDQIVQTDDPGDARIIQFKTSRYRFHLTMASCNFRSSSIAP